MTWAYLCPTRYCIFFFTNRQQFVRIHSISFPIILNTSSPQGCVLSPLLFTVLNDDCSAKHTVKFADDMAVLGLSTHSDESKSKQEVEIMDLLCKVNHLSISVKKTKEMTVGFSETGTTPPLHIGGVVVEVVS